MDPAFAAGGAARARPLTLASVLLLSACLFDDPERSAKELIPGEGAFRIVLLPDTQYYSFGPHIDTFFQQTHWIASNASDMNIVFAIHLGDITEANAHDQWRVASEAMGALDGVVPYSLLPGNHDGLEHGIIDTARFNTYFPLERFAGQVGGSRDGSNDNTYWLFSAGGENFLVLSLAYGVPDEVIDWAGKVVSSHPERHVIVATHAYMNHDGTRLKKTDLYGPNHSRWNDGEQIWEGLIRRHPNIFLVVSGHIHGGGLLVSRGDHGNKVFEMLANYQAGPNGGNGWLRILTFDPAQGKIGVRAYSPTLDQTMHHIDHTFTLRYTFPPL